MLRASVLLAVVILTACASAMRESTTASGLRYRKISGTADGPRPSPTDAVTIHYVGRFIEGGEFDSSVARGEPATFPLPRLIRGWQEGVPLMAVGGYPHSIASAAHRRTHQQIE